MSVRARGAVPAPSSTGSRLEAVLAAGMARMALVPTDAPKRVREEDFEDVDAALADLLGPDEDEEGAPTPQENTAPLNAFPNPLMQAALAEAAPRDLAPAGMTIGSPARMLTEQLVQEMLAFEDTMDIDAIRRYIKAIADLVVRLYPNVPLRNAHRHAKEYRLQWSTKSLMPSTRPSSRQARATPSPPAKLWEEVQAQLDADEQAPPPLPPPPLSPPPFVPALPNPFDDGGGDDDDDVKNEAPPPGTKQLEFEPDAPLRILPAWMTNPLPPRPSDPTYNSVKPEAGSGNNRDLTKEELAFLFWYTMHPVELNREIRVAAPKLDVTEAEFRKRSTALRSRLRRDYGLVVPGPFAAPWYGPPLGPEPEPPIDSSVDKRDALGKRLTTVSELRYLYWFAMNPEALKDEAVLEEAKRLLSMTKEEIQQRTHKIKLRVEQWEREAEEGIGRSSSRTSTPSPAQAPSSGGFSQNQFVSDEQADAIHVMVLGWNETANLTVQQRRDDIKDLAYALNITQQTIFWYLGEHYPKFVPQKYHRAN